MATKHITVTSLHRQKGVASLLVALVILVTITFVTLYTSRTVLMEQKVTTNEYRGRMAFEAAETGIDAVMAASALGWLRTNDADGDQVPDGGDYPVLVNNGVNVVFDTDGDGAPDTNTTELVNGSRVQVQVMEASTDDMVRTNVISTGWSDDRTARRVIYQSIVAVSPIPNMPDSPLLTRGSAVIGGSVQVYNPEGNSTIWTGRDVNLGGNSATKTEIANPTDPNYPNCLGGSVKCGTVESSNQEIAGLDIIESDSSLSNLDNDEFFQNFFGTTPAVYKDSRVTIVTTDLPGESGATGEIIWAEPDVDGEVVVAGNPVYGTPTEPVVVVVDGDLTGTGNIQLFGILYVTGSMLTTGNVNVTGAVLVQGNTATGGGNFRITYNSSVLKALFNEGPPASASASWRDFNVN